MAAHMPMFYDRVNEELVQPLRQITITDTHLASNTFTTDAGAETIGLFTDFTHHTSALSKDRGGVRHSNDSQAYEDVVFKARGNRSAPLTTLASDELYKLRACAYNGATYAANAEIIMSNDAVSATRGNIDFRTRNAAGNLTTKLSLGSEDIGFSPEGDLTLAPTGDLTCAPGDDFLVNAGDAIAMGSTGTTDIVSTGILTLASTGSNVLVTSSAGNISMNPVGQTFSVYGGTNVTLSGSGQCSMISTANTVGIASSAGFPITLQANGAGADITISATDECNIGAGTGKLLLESTTTNVELTAGDKFVVDATNGSEFPDGITVQSGTHNTTWGGSINPPLAGNIVWRKSNETVTLNIPTISSAGFAAGAGIDMTTNLPAALQPATSKIWIIVVEDNTAYQYGTLELATNGDIIIRPGVTGANFTGANVGMVSTSVTYACS